MKHVTTLVSGKVQGVFFRAATKEQADLLGVKGFVRNEPDGNVYIEAEGEEPELNEFIRWCSHGPSRARVDRIENKEGEVKYFQNFEVRR